MQGGNQVWPGFYDMEQQVKAGQGQEQMMFFIPFLALVAPRLN